MAEAVSIVTPVELQNFPNPITADDPIYASPNTTEDCAAAMVTTITALAVGVMWHNARKDAISKQNAIESRILSEFDKDNAFYKTVDQPQQMEAINYALDLEACEIECHPCLNDVEVKTGCFSFVGDSCHDMTQFSDTMSTQGRMQAKFDDRQNAKQLYIDCVQDNTTALIRATNLSFIDYSRAYAYYQNASAIHGGLAGMAAQGYQSSVREFNYGLNILGTANGTIF